MAATLAQDTTLAQDATFKARVQAAMVRYLIGILANQTSLSSGNLALARQMIYDPATFAAQIAYGIATDSAIQARDGVVGSVTDAEIIAAVAALLPRYVR